MPGDTDGQTPKRKREPLSRDRVLQAALAFIDEHGVEALSMRRLASTLGVEAMSLYNHIDDKEDLLNGVLDTVVDEADVEPLPGEHWKETLRRGSESLLNAFAQHPPARQLMVNYAGHRAQARIVNTFYGVLHEAGYPAPAIHSAWHLISSYFNGHLLTHEHIAPLDDEEREAAVRRLRMLPPEDFRHQYAEYIADCHPRDEFTTGIQVVLDGMEQYLEESRRAARGRRSARRSGR